MAGRRTLTLQKKVLEALAGGPLHKAELARALMLDPCLRNRHLLVLLQDMRLAGLVECVGRGTWKIADGLEVCSHCCGKGVLRKGGA
jgi:hypothetical protein